MRVILDTNVLLGALISSYGTSSVVYQAWRSGHFELLTSVAQLDEIRRASRYPKLKKLVPAHRVGTMVNNLQRAVVLQTLEPLPDQFHVSDPDDAFLLAMAITGKADYLVTGDRHAGLLQYGHVDRTRIVLPRAFVDEGL